MPGSGSGSGSFPTGTPQGIKVERRKLVLPPEIDVIDTQCLINPGRCCNTTDDPDGHDADCCPERKLPDTLYLMLCPGYYPEAGADPLGNRPRGCARDWYLSNEIEMVWNPTLSTWDGTASHSHPCWDTTGLGTIYFTETITITAWLDGCFLQGLIEWSRDGTPYTAYLLNTFGGGEGGMLPVMAESSCDPLFLTFFDSGGITCILFE